MRTRAKVGGPKTVRCDVVVTLHPDLIIANMEENRAADIQALRAAGIPVWITVIRTVDEALRSLRRMLTQACRLPAPGWLADAERAWDRPLPARRCAAVIPVWRRPWMVVGRDTFTGDVLGRLGVGNVFGWHPERYPKIPLDQIVAAGPDLVVLPDEPYRFTTEDGPECFPGIDAALVSGRYLTWYGPSLVDAPKVLNQQLGTATRYR